VTRENNVLLIFEEVISLRVAYGGARGRYRVTPDLTAIGKSSAADYRLGPWGSVGKYLPELR
jgi:glutamate-1-semialdehyde 2,1-aminomutase